MHIHNHSLVDSDLTSGDMRVLTDRQELDDRQVRLLEPSLDKILEKIILNTNVFNFGDEYGSRCKDLFTFITLSDSPLVVRGVNVDSSPIYVTYEGDTIFGVVHYSEDYVANVLSLGNTIDSSYKFRYLASHDEFLLQMTGVGRTYIFHRNVGTNTYVCNLDSDVADSKYINFKERVTLATTVAQNKQKYSHREIKAAAIARTYQNNLGPCSDGELIKLISREKLDNNRVVAQDVIRALDIWGPSLANLKGKTVSHKAELQEEITTLTNQFKADQTMLVDLIFVNNVPYSISVFKPLEYVAVTKLVKKDINTLLTATINHINIIRKHGIIVVLC